MAFRSKTLPMPYLSKLQGAIQPGQCIFIKGHMTGSTRFDISLHTGPHVAGASRDDIAMCFSTRVDEKHFVLNSFKNGEWGKEVKEKVNIKQGEDVDIRIRAHEDAWEIWAQGKTVATFDFRMPLTAINHIYIVGEFELNRCAWEGRYYPMPFQTALPSQAIAPGKSIYIAGACEKKCEKFEIDIKSGNDYILHMNPRFKEKKIIRNSCRGGVWDDVEEADGPDFPFTKDHAFDIMISCEPELYRIYVNGEEFCSYRHRLAPDSADNLCIDGDITIQGIHW